MSNRRTCHILHCLGLPRQLNIGCLDLAVIAAVQLNNPAAWREERYPFSIRTVILFASTWTDAKKYVEVTR